MDQVDSADLVDSTAPVDLTVHDGYTGEATDVDAPALGPMDDLQSGPVELLAATTAENSDEGLDQVGTGGSEYREGDGTAVLGTLDGSLNADGEALSSDPRAGHEQPGPTDLGAIARTEVAEGGSTPVAGEESGPNNRTASAGPVAGSVSELIGTLEADDNNSVQSSEVSTNGPLSPASGAVPQKVASAPTDHPSPALVQGLPASTQPTASVAGPANSPAAGAAQLADLLDTRALAEALRPRFLGNEKLRSLSLRLNPGDLGALRIEARLIEGATHLTLSTSTQSGNERIAASLEDLRNQLTSAGIDLGNLELRDGSTSGSSSEGDEARDPEGILVRSVTVGATSKGAQRRSAVVTDGVNGLRVDL